MLDVFVIYQRVTYGSPLLNKSNLPSFILVMALINTLVIATFVVGGISVRVIISILPVIVPQVYVKFTLKKTVNEVNKKYKARVNTKWVYFDQIDCKICVIKQIKINIQLFVSKGIFLNMKYLICVD